MAMVAMMVMATATAKGMAKAMVLDRAVAPVVALVVAISASTWAATWMAQVMVLEMAGATTLTMATIVGAVATEVGVGKQQVRISIDSQFFFGDYSPLH
jgi:hypothetical protein